jgi:hypothetical protein
MSDDRRRRLARRATAVFAVLGAITTVIALWEFAVRDRSLPTFTGHVSLCPPEMFELEADGEDAQDDYDLEAETTAWLSALGTFLVRNASTAVFLDIDTINVCEPVDGEWLVTYGDHTVRETENKVTFELATDDDQIAGAFLMVDKRLFEDSGLSRVQPGRTEMSGERIIGSFFVRGNLNAGLFELSLAPVGYSRALDDLTVCSRALAYRSSVFERTRAYIGTCLLGLPDPELMTRY